MKRTQLRFAVLMDYALSAFQEAPKAGIERYLGESGIEAVYFSMGRLNPVFTEDLPFLAFFDFLTPKAFDGIILVSTSLVQRGGSDVLREKLSAIKGLPMISIGPSLLGEESVCINNVSGMYSIVRHLIDVHGFSRFAYVSGPLTSDEARMRLFAFHAALDEAGIEHDEAWEYEGNFLSDSGAAAVPVFLDERALDPQVIVCANDLMAHGVCKAIRARGLNIPYDIAVTGYDDDKFFNVLSHRLTTVSQSFENLGYLAAQRLHSTVAGKPLPPIGPLDTELRIRSSCGCLEFADRRNSAQAVPTPSFTKADAALLAELRDRVAALVRDGCSVEDVHDVYRTWFELVCRTLDDERPVHELEEFLRSIPGMRTKSSAETPFPSASLIQSLYMLLLEECNETVFIKYWDGWFFDLRLRMLVDRLRDEIVKDLSLSAHSDIFRELADLCGAKSFHLVRFRDFLDINGGATPVFSFGPWEGLSETIAPGNWLPPRGSGSFTVNMITSGKDRFGYIMLDSGIARISVHDALRLRFSYISRDLLTLSNTQKLNQKLMAEITAREDTERKLKDAFGMVEQLSVEDELTHLHNRRGFLSLAAHQIKYLRRQKRAFFILYADLDGLKAINDKWGHNDGDLAIASAAKALKGALRDTDIVARMGGDEFTALVCEALPPSYESIKRRISESVERASAGLNRPWKLSISIGCYHSLNGDGRDLEEMLSLADGDLYREKQSRKGGSK